MSNLSLIVHSDNAKNLAGQQAKWLLVHMCSAARLKLVAYYHNEAQSGKDVCDTHFSHQKTHVDAYTCTWCRERVEGKSPLPSRL